ncbi:hypothetical protein AK812_SmicGene32435 [Symbiodinium microadriaticum]|uniref:Uncharacterized protein n=1 Tax=Symbiodinium microadriaticum TaxID=2951 RepID=A0A1Q9CU52_SYMMI|nr:hypothetical protein AK812_SmicGene32435 [Symbiodinium microadriaticum]
MRRKLSELGAVPFRAGVQGESLISFGVREWPTEEHRIHSLAFSDILVPTLDQSLRIARAGRDRSLADALRIAVCLMGDLFRWLGPGQGRTTKAAELDRDTVEELRGLFAKHAALPTIRVMSAKRFGMGHLASPRAARGYFQWFISFPTAFER